MIQYVYQAIKKKIAEAVLEVAQVDWYYKQYEESEDGNLVWTTPSVYIEFPTIEFDDRAKYQRSTIEITIHVVSASAYGAEDFRQTDDTDGLTITHLGLCQKIYKALQGWSCAYSYLPSFQNNDLLVSSTLRRRMEVSHDLSAFNVTKITFAMNVQDCDAVEQLVLVEPPITAVLTADFVAQITN